MLQSIGQRLSGSRAPKDSDSQGDAGFTLTEIIWALFLMGIVAMAALALFLNGMTSVSELQRQQTAASLAAAALDQARSVAGSAVNSNNTSGLVKGRSHTAVTAAWDDWTDFDPALTSDMNMGGGGHPAEVWDVAPGMTTADQWLPIRSEHTVGTQDFTVDTIVGLCYRLKKSPDVGQACTQNRAGVNDEPMYRVRVLVRWDTGNGEVQSYTASTLVDPTDDPIWNTALLPYAYDDEFTVIAGDPESYHAIVANDSIDMAAGGPNPIWDPSDPVAGDVRKGTGDSNQGIFFDPPDHVSGTVTFTYHLKDAAGLQSAVPATVMVHILPGARDDDLSVPIDSVTELNDLLLDNDIGVPNLSPDRVTTIHPFIDPAVDYFATEEVTPEMIAERNADIAALAARGVTVSSDGIVSFQAPSDLDAEINFSYYLVDSPRPGVEGPLYPNVTGAATVTITTSEPPPPSADGDFDLNASSAQTWHELDWRTLTGNDDPDMQIRVTGRSSNSNTHVRIDGATTFTAPGDVLEFRTNNSNIGVYTLDYVVVSAGGTESDEARLTVTVAPVAGDATFSHRYNRNLDITVRDYAIPNATNIRATALSPTTCGTAQLRDSDRQIRFRTPNQVGLTCTFQYYVQTTGANGVRSHDPGTITVTVTN